MISKINDIIFLRSNDSKDFENGKKIFHCPMSSQGNERASERTSERSGARKQSKQCVASERANDRTDERVAQC